MITQSCIFSDEDIICEPLAFPPPRGCVAFRFGHTLDRARRFRPIFPAGGSGLGLCFFLLDRRGASLGVGVALRKRHAKVGGKPSINYATYNIYYSATAFLVLIASFWALKPNLTSFFQPFPNFFAVYFVPSCQKIVRIIELNGRISYARPFLSFEAISGCVTSETNESWS